MDIPELACQNYPLHNLWFWFPEDHERPTVVFLIRLGVRAGKGDRCGCLWPVNSVGEQAWDTAGNKGRGVVMQGLCGILGGQSRGQGVSGGDACIMEREGFFCQRLGSESESSLIW